MNLFIQSRSHLSLDLSPPVRSVRHEFGKDERPCSFVSTPHNRHVSNRCLFSLAACCLPCYLWLLFRLGDFDCVPVEVMVLSLPFLISKHIRRCVQQPVALSGLSSCHDWEYCICEQAVHFSSKPFVSVNRLTWSCGTVLACQLGWFFPTGARHMASQCFCGVAFAWFYIISQFYLVQPGLFFLYYFLCPG